MSVVGVLSERFVSRGFAVVVVLLALFGWSAVFASSARADSHNGEITISCNGWSIELANYGSLELANYGSLDQNILGVSVDGVTLTGPPFGEFQDGVFASGTWTEDERHTLLILVVDPEDPPPSPTSNGPRGWTFTVEETSPACDEEQIKITVPVTTTAPAAATASTLPLTGATPVSPAVLAAVVLLGSGVLVVLFARRAED